jgi:hypothetical protein
MYRRPDTRIDAPFHIFLLFRPDTDPFLLGNIVIHLLSMNWGVIIVCGIVYEVVRLVVVTVYTFGVDIYIILELPLLLLFGHTFKTREIYFFLSQILVLFLLLFSLKNLHLQLPLLLLFYFLEVDLLFGSNRW